MPLEMRSPLASRKAAHETGPTQEPTEADEADDREGTGREQQELEEPGSSGGCSFLNRYVSGLFFSNKDGRLMTYANAKRVEVIAGDDNREQAVRE